MKNFKSLLACIFLIGTLVISCGGGIDGKANEKDAKIELPSTGQVAESGDSFDAPVFSETSTPQDFKNGIEKLVNEIEKSLEGVKPLEKKLTIFNKPNTPAKIWYSEKNKQPIKIELGEANDAGEFTGLSSYYLVNGDLWYSNQPFAKFVFESERLKYWLDENWNINEIPEENLKDREKLLNENIAIIINW